MFLMQRYGPRQLADLYLPEETRLLLQASLGALNNLNVLLLGGPSTGKTTLLEILQREYYGQEVDTKVMEKNVLAVSSLREQGLQFFRQEIKTFCQTYSCVPGRKKCIVIDDLDLVNEQSQQIFRNFVDRYSHRVHFLASCSNPQKVIEPLRSRLLCITLEPVPEQYLLEVLEKIAAQEAMAVDADAKGFLVRLCRRSVKVMLHFLEKVKLMRLSTPLSLSLAQDLCCDVPFADLEYVLSKLQQAGQEALAEAVGKLTQLHARGFSVIDILDNFHTFLRMTALLSEPQKHAVLPCLCKYIAIFHNLHEDDLELIFFANHMQQCLTQTK